MQHMTTLTHVLKKKNLYTYKKHPTHLSANRKHWTCIYRPIKNTEPIYWPIKNTKPIYWPINNQHALLTKQNTEPIYWSTSKHLLTNKKHWTHLPTKQQSPCIYWPNKNNEPIYWPINNQHAFTDQWEHVEQQLLHHCTLVDFQLLYLLSLGKG